MPMLRGLLGRDMLAYGAACVLASLAGIAACVGDTPTPDEPTDAGATDAPTTDTGGGGDSGGDSVLPCTPLAPKKIPAAGILAWTGTDYGLVSLTDVADNKKEIVFHQLDAQGNSVAGPKQITNEAAETYDAMATTVWLWGLVWMDDRFGVLWSRETLDAGGALLFTQLQRNGDRFGGTTDTDIGTQIGPGFGGARMDWNGQSLGITYVGGGGIRAQRRAKNGEAIGPGLTVAEFDGGGGTKSHPVIAGTTAGFGVAWRDGRSGDDEIWFGRIDPNGTVDGVNKRITNAGGLSIRPRIVANGTGGYGIAWEDSRAENNPEVFFQRLDAAGGLLGDPLRLTTHPSMATGIGIVWTGSEYGVAWHDARSSNDEIYLARIDANGARIGDDKKVTDSPATSNTLGVWWTGTKYAIAWSEDPGGGTKEGWIAEVCP